MRIVIWGYGSVGKSLLSYFSHRGHKLVVCSANITSDKEAEINSLGATYLDQSHIASLSEWADWLIPSPGIDVTSYPIELSKIVPELDLFCSAWHKPIVGVTGTVGKTSIVHCAGALLNNLSEWAVGGNIGIPLMQLISSQTDLTQGALLELSSFQLEWSQPPPLALGVIATIYPNHLDRHRTYESYVTIKKKLLRNAQQCLVPGSWVECSPHSMVLTKGPWRDNNNEIGNEYILEKNHIVRKSNNDNTILCSLDGLNATTFPSNWITICAILDALQVMPKAEDFSHYAQGLSLPSHRLKHIATKQSVLFFNDSKATLPEATLAAVATLKQPIILILGGTSKGVNRLAMIQQTVCEPHIKAVVILGSEHTDLISACKQSNKPWITLDTMQEALYAALRYAHPGDAILLSPSGASYDRFTDYQERGALFEHLVYALPE